MYVGLLGLDLALAVLVLGAAAGAAHAATAVQDAAARRRLLLVLLTGVAVLLVARTGVGLTLAASYDPAFAARRLLVDVPLLAALTALAFVAVAGRVRSRLLTPAVTTWTVAAAAAFAVVDALVVPRPLPTGVLVLLAVAGPPLVLARPRGPRLARAVATALVAVPALALLASTGASWWQSRLPATYDLAAYAPTDAGGGPAGHAHAHGAGAGGAGVETLRGPQDGDADARFTLTAARAEVPRTGARPRRALAFNGSIPGPALQVHQGDLVEVTLANADIDEGVTVHWHGLDVPNAEDGVAGVTQDAVPPGARHVYRFRAEQAGTYWYHSHQHSSVQVEQGLYGALVVLPRLPLPAGTVDLAVVDHAWRGPQGFAAGGSYDAAGRVERHAVAAGTPVRLRLVNSDSAAHRYRVDGVAFRVAAVDGTDVHDPALVAGRDLRLAGGGRYDLVFDMPAGPVTLHGLGAGERLVLGDGPASAAGGQQPLLDLATYGSPGATPSAADTFDREFVVDIDQQVSFREGRLGWHWTVNGHSYPQLPMLVVSRGDLVRVRIANRSTAAHPMHLHGHHVVVLSRNGRPATGSPWWTDTLDVAPGERYEVAFRADNPGIWMNHCHDLGHAAAGFVMHLAYEGVSTPYVVGGRAANRPE